ncbi:MAG: uncharacterized protein QOF76_3254 [Solirubrobacteraceae bacterium]|nr:uncharacterized protein [Solirubrobacteraceae bacterium]
MPRGSRALPPACVAHCQNADAILHCGDFMHAVILDQFEAYGPPVYAVYGNVDEPAVRHRVPERRTVTLDGVRIGMVHDPGSSLGRIDRLHAWFPDAQAVLFGHTHQPQHDTAPDSFQIFNPGSPTERRRAPAHTMGLAQVADGRITFELVTL